MLAILQVTLALVMFVSGFYFFYLFYELDMHKLEMYDEYPCYVFGALLIGEIGFGLVLFSLHYIIYGKWFP